jgi:two-component system chemotaxis response regulator CheB
MSLEAEQRSGAEDAPWSAVRRLEEKLLLVQEQLSLAETTNSAEARAFRAELAPLEAAIEALRRLAIESAATMPHQSTD